MILRGRPPNFDKIVAVFSSATKAGTIFAYAPNIYLSSKHPLSPALEAHEMVHIKRQEAYEGGAAAWWDRYLVDRAFRYDEELVAHAAEYRYIEKHGSRAERRTALKLVASRLCGALYSLGLSPKQAADAILGVQYET